VRSVFVYCLRDIVYLLAKVNVERSLKPKVRSNGVVLYLVPGGSLAALRAADLNGVAYSVTKPATSSRIF